MAKGSAALGHYQIRDVTSGLDTNADGDPEHDPKWIESVAKRRFPQQYDLTLRDATVRATVLDVGEVAQNPTAAGTNELRRISSMIPAIPRSSPRVRDAFIPLQEWEGLVLEVRADGGFVARLTDVAAQGQSVEEEAEFPATEINDDDRPLVVAGAIFRWTVGFLRSSAGTRKRTSQVVFRRLPQWTKNDLARADKQADELSGYFAHRGPEA